MFDFGHLWNHKEKYDIINEKATGKFKKETPKKTGVEDLCALKTKAFCFKLNAEIEIKNLKRLSKVAIRNVKSDTYSNGLFDTLTEKDDYLINTTLRNKNQIL